MPSQHFQLTPEQQAISLERKRKRDEARGLISTAQTTPPMSSGSTRPQNPRSILHRNWLVKSESSETLHRHQITIASWNMLAQCLVRRELFPHSNCLKAQQREGMLHEEITYSNADILCLQEVDRLERLLPMLKAAGYAHVLACGPRKLHGCLIAYRESMFRRTANQIIFYDDAYVHDEGNEEYRKGLSFRTKNIALIIALQRLDFPGDSEHYVVATTHLFWHPRYTYERARQAYVLVRSVEEFRIKNDTRQSRLLIAGDFNFPPNDAVYSLLVGDALTAQQILDILKSRVVHVTVDATVPIKNKRAAADDDEAAAGGEAGDGSRSDEEFEDPARVIVNARAARPEDGLLQPDEFIVLFKDVVRGGLTSAYDSWTSFPMNRTFGSRGILSPDRSGHNEPVYTSYTHYWKTTLDYIFLASRADASIEVTGILQPPTQEELVPGIPRQGICGSDHISLRATLSFSGSRKPA